IGVNALFSNTSGINNTACGDFALNGSTTGSGNIALGTNAGASVTTANGVICIGAAGDNVDNSCYIGQIFGATSTNGLGVFVNVDGKLGTTTSSQRFKEAIKPMDRASEAIFALKPVSFRYKKEIDQEGRSQFGLVAEDVEKVNPDFVVRDKEGKAYSVRYDQVNAMLLNEFLKEHCAFGDQKRKVKELEAALAHLKKQVETVVAHAKEQDSKIQTVNDEIALNRNRRDVVQIP